MIYLDHNATTPPCDEALAAMREAARLGWANPSSVHAAGRAARRFVDEAREAVARLAGESPRDVVFTSGGTEANNLGLARPFGGAPGLLVTSRLEHPSVVAFAEELARRGAVELAWLEPAPGGAITPDALALALSRRPPGRPALVALHAVHHETGAVQDVAALVARAEALGAEVHVDAVQAAGRVPHALWRGGHTTALAAHKLRGPKGVGALVTRPGVNARPILRGGSQERGLRPGTLDAVAVAGFGAAARRALEGGPERYAALAPLRDALEARTLEAGRRLGVAIEPTPVGRRAPHVSHLLVGGWAGDELAAALDLEGVCVSSGSACAAGTAEPSPAIVALVGEARARSSLRVSLGETSQPADVDAFVDALALIIGRRAGPPSTARTT
ncbi:MAG TPA: aminotransferase class V-fold PLP-dependent enzyme [Polyangiaceae bacterium]|nr:aminotransferase class V-fold PLP-dependent enzyme [Polyangiaceae bacterium]